MLRKKCNKEIRFTTGDEKVEVLTNTHHLLATIWGLVISLGPFLKFWLSEYHCMICGAQELLIIHIIYHSKQVICSVFPWSFFYKCVAFIRQYGEMIHVLNIYTAGVKLAFQIWLRWIPFCHFFAAPLIPHSSPTLRWQCCLIDSRSARISSTFDINVFPVKPISLMMEIVSGRIPNPSKKDSRSVASAKIGACISSRLNYVRRSKTSCQERYTSSTRMWKIIKDSNHNILSLRTQKRQLRSVMHKLK